MVIGQMSSRTEISLNFMIFSTRRRSPQWFSTITTIYSYSFSAGAFLGPVVVKPFLTIEQSSKPLESTNQSGVAANASSIIDDGATLNRTELTAVPPQLDPEDFGIRTIYPILAGVAGLISLACLAMGLYTRRSPSLHQELKRPDETGTKPSFTADSEQPMKLKDGSGNGEDKGYGVKTAFTVVMIAYFFLYVGMEVRYSTLLYKLLLYESRF